MTGQRPTLEMFAPTIEEAIENGLEELGLTREAVDIEILDEGNFGFRKALFRWMAKHTATAF